ncbi:MAG TPA: hypothetical protein VFS56_04225, partial [Gemmatimonadaceae bacterium]|nr:hypothetical protein [Gemmatimonadaceae bacterium]
LVVGGTDGPFSFVVDGTLTLHDLEWVCHHLVVELNAPPASADLGESDEVLRVRRNMDRLQAPDSEALSDA